MTRRGRGVCAAVLAAGALVPAATSEATWSIILVDTRTGEVAIGCATCLTTLDLQEFTPVMLVGVGAAAAQAAVTGTQFANRTYIRDRMVLGQTPGQIISGLGAIDSFHASRQYGIVDVLGRRGTFTGPQAGQYRGGQAGTFSYTYAGQTGTVAYAVQGNVLTGAPVIQAAVDAARNTPADLPGRLMAAMEAARAMGGDGRCSCTSGGGPTGCGAPPPSFTKSAHIGYMLVGRAGDTDGSQGYYRTGTDNAGTAALVLRDFNGDGVLDIAAANSGDATAGIILNTTGPGAPFIMFGPPSGTAVGAVPVAIAAADFNVDGVEDLITADQLGNRVSVLPGLGGGSFSAAVATAVSGAPVALAAAEFNGGGGPDVAVITSAPSLMVHFGDGAGGFSGFAPLSIGTNPRAVLAVQADGAGGTDLVVAVGGQSRLAVYLGDGSGGFVAGADIPTPATPHAVAAGDFDGDGDQDLAVVHQSTPPRMSIQERTGGGYSQTVVELPASPNHVAAGDVNGDGDLDLVVPLNGGRFAVYFGGAGATFSAAGNYDITAEFAQTGVNRVELGDLDNDGDLDAAFAVSTFSSAVICENLGGGVFRDGGVAASGDYFMAFNVANQPADAEDPVLQMTPQFNAWRAGLAGRADAVQSRVTVPEGLVAGSSNTGVMTITLRDWQAEVITGAAPTVTVEHAPGAPLATSIGAVTQTGPGEYEVVLTPTNAIGVDRYVIRAGYEASRPIELMPRPSAGVIRCPADWNADDSVNSADVSAFLTAWLASLNGGTLAGDFNGDMVVNSADISAFLTRWLAGVTGTC